MSDYQELSRSVKGRKVIVTGAASGMGWATAHLFAREGAHVAVTDLSLDACEKVVAEIEAAGFDTAKAWAMDMADNDMIARVTAEIATAFGGLDIIINNAGFNIVAPIDSDIYKQGWDASMAAMLEGPTTLIRESLPHLRRSDAPRIINISSTEGLGGSANISPYTVAKHGIIGLTHALSAELGKEGITVNAICPGPIHSALTEAVPEEHKQIFARRKTAIRRYGLPEEVAHMTLSLALPAASYITGTAIPVDGGMRARNN